MTQGVLSSLEVTLRRLDSIESDFNKLFSVNSVKKNSNAEDFKKILDEKMSSADNNNDKAEILDKIELPSAQKSVSATKVSETGTASKIGKRETINNLIEKYATKNGLDPDFIKAMVNQESGFNSSAKSKAGASGLMQLMPSTAKGLGVTDIFDPEQNIEGGVKYIKSMMDRFNQDPKLALAAYNAGPNAVKRYGGIPPYKETQNYVKNIMSAYNNIKTKGANQ